MRFDVCVGDIKGGLYARKKKTLRIYVCVGSVQGSCARKEETLNVFLLGIYKIKLLKNYYWDVNLWDLQSWCVRVLKGQ